MARGSSKGDTVSRTKKTSIGMSRNSRQRHKAKKRDVKRYRGQGR